MSTSSASTSPKRTSDAIYLRSTEEFIHHNLVLRQGPVAAVAAFSYRVRTPEDLDKAVAFYEELGCRVERRAEGFANGIGDSVRVDDPLGFPYEFFHQTEHVERLVLALRPPHARRARPPGPLQPGHPRRAARGQLHAVPRVPGHRRHPGRRGHRLRRVDAPQAHRARHRDDRRRRSADAPRRVRDPREAQHPRDLRQARRAPALRRHRARPRPPRRVERVLPLPARPRRAPRRDLHAGLLHRRPRQPGRSRGTSTTTSAATGGATPSSRPGTPRHPSSSTSTATRSPSSPAPTRARWP